MRTHQQTQSGFSVIEILVAMLIALLGIIIIFQVFAVSEDIKRTSTSGGDAQQFGALATFTIERDLRMAGYGINNANLLGCEIRSYDELATPKVRPVYTLLPVELVAGASTAIPDEITLTYGSSDLMSSPVDLTQDMGSPTSDFRVSGRFGFVLGGLVIVAEAGEDCTLAEITALPTAAGQTDVIVRNSGSYVDAGGNTVTARHNSAAGLGVTYTTEANVFNLGTGPVRNTYSIFNNQLIITRSFGSGTATMPIADNIVSLKALYGKDTDADGTIDIWQNFMPSPIPTPAEWLEIIVMRVALLARSAQPERPSGGGACDTTTVAPSWSGGSFDVSADLNWMCYRYRVFESTVPLRNLMWQQLP